MLAHLLVDPMGKAETRRRAHHGLQSDGIGRHDIGLALIWNGFSSLQAPAAFLRVGPVMA